MTDAALETGAQTSMGAKLLSNLSVAAGHAGSFLAMTFLGGNHLRTSIAQFFARALEWR